MPRAARDEAERLHMLAEGVHLRAIDFVAGERARQGVDADILRLDVARGLVDLPVKGRGFDFAALAARVAECRVLPEQAEHVQSALDHILEGHVVVLCDRGQTAMNLVHIVFGAEIECRAGLR